ncbi:MAG: cardiolipin synthase [Tissierellaceae bacterium]|nr:cardiolipin synthase [Tissierellaceae bacterium]
MDALFQSYGWIFRNILWINIIFAILLIFFERRDPTTTWLWLMVLTFLPGIGFVLYLFIGQDLSKNRMFKIKEEEDYCFRDMAIIQEEQMRKDLYRYKDPNYIKYEDLIVMNLISAESFFTQDNQIELYFEGNDKFNALIDSIRRAKSYIHLQYYIFKSDELGKKIIDELCIKAREGIEVKLLVDGMGGRRLTQKSMRKLKEAGGEVAIFFPAVIPFISLRINYRNHRKICIIDGKEGFVGGFNVGDEYIGLSKKFGYWRDTHIKLRGSAISSLQWRFFLDWRFATGTEITRCQTYLANEDELGSTGVQIVSSGPDSKWPSIKNGYLKMISNAKEKVYIQTPYFIPDDSIFEALRLAGLSRLDVRVMIPCKPDHPFVYWASMSYIGELLRSGVRFYTYEKGFLHSKAVIMDDFVSSVGTANLDIRSFKLNFEVNAFIYDEGINMKITERFLEDLQYCKEITIEEHEKRSKIVRIKESVSRLLSPIL